MILAVGDLQENRPSLDRNGKTLVATQGLELLQPLVFSFVGHFVFVDNLLQMGLYVKHLAGASKRAESAIGAQSDYSGRTGTLLLLRSAPPRGRGRPYDDDRLSRAGQEPLTRPSYCAAPRRPAAAQADRSATDTIPQSHLVWRSGSRRRCRHSDLVRGFPRKAGALL